MDKAAAVLIGGNSRRWMPQTQCVWIEGAITVKWRLSSRQLQGKAFGRVFQFKVPIKGVCDTLVQIWAIAPRSIFTLTNFWTRAPSILVALHL